MFKTRSVCLVSLLLGLSACSGNDDTDAEMSNVSADDDADDDDAADDDDDADDDDAADDPAFSAALDEARLTYARIVLASYEDSLELATTLDSALGEVVAEPSAATLDDAKAAWLAAREPYLETEVYRFYEGPIDNAEDGPEGALNAWPLDENYIDYVEGDAEAGIINDPETEIEAEALLALNEQGGEKNIATGYHAIEFLLWGQDRSADGPGERPFTDYLRGDEGTALNQGRRATYLTTVSTLLLEHLSQLADAWSEDDDNYRAEFEGASPTDAMRRMLTGMIVLSGFETGGERLQAALDTGEQEDEHSCFSDNTHRDMVQDVQGVLNVYHGRYERLDGSVVSGTGVRDVVEMLDATLAEDLEAQIEESLMLAEALEPPFDREIQNDNSEGRARVQALIDSLRAQERLLEDVFVGLGLMIPQPE